jgi:hypothetical protein
LSSATLRVHRSQNLVENITKFAILLGLVAVVAVIGYASLQTSVAGAL